MFRAQKREEVKETVRRVKANDRAFTDQHRHSNNYIKTSKYSVITFLPKNLFEQFQRLANFYFLVLMILQLIPQISSLTALTTILPLVSVLTVTAIKDAVDDLQRHRNDNMVNNRTAHVVRQGKLVAEKWQTVRVGDIIKMESDNFIAADLFLISTSEPHGLCYVETAELDGETNLKAKQALPETAAMLDDLKQIGAFDGEITCEPPNNRLSTFEGRLTWRNQQFCLDNEKMLLRGCVIRNTKWCYGVVVFAGRDTKLMMNSGKTKFKRTSLDRFLNVLIIGIVIFLLSMCFICTVLCGVWETVYGRRFEVVLPWDTIVPRTSNVTASIAFISFLMFFSYAILLNTVVPISLYVSVEIIRFCHSWWINWDLDMYHPITDTAARSRTTTLSEELGQIQYIFSDKTGTLTQNVMTFNKCTINGRVYGEILDEKGHSMDTSTMKPVDFTFNKWSEAKFRWLDRNLLEVTKIDDHVKRFWRLIALCHTVMPESKAGKLEYQAQSPDEAALVGAARNFGYVFKSRTPNSITIEVNDQEETYDLLCILDFNNVRKRMSVLVRKDGKLTLFCKGADTMIFERLNYEADGHLIDVTQAHLDKFANEGLRTLCLAYKDISPEFYESWNKRQREASVSLENRQEKLDAVYEEIEQGLTLIGATAIEDKLQDGVPETIANLAAANIKIWVLTGDKQETAINIGYSCRLLTEDLRDICVVDAQTYDEVNNQLLNIKHQMAAGTSKPDTPDRDQNTTKPPLPLAPTGENRARFSNQENGLPTVTVYGANNQQITTGGEQTGGSSDQFPLEGYALVINGHSLLHALDSKMESLLLEVGTACKAVICCRVTPLQKALVVDLVKRHKKAVTLAVGDGANDVSMIKTAHIGVGISGQEGMQAVLASDFSVAQFRFLEKLLLVHGRWSYFRMCKFLRYFFYKNFAFTLVHFWFSFFCAYSAQTIYDPLFIACYNLVFTALPVIALGIFDQDVDVRHSLRYPRLYIPGQYNLYFNMRIFVYSVLHGIFSSVVLFFIAHATLSENVDADGSNIDDLWTLGFTIFSALVVTVTAQVALDTSYWTKFNHLVIWGSLLMYFLVAMLYNEGVTFNRVMKQPSFGVVFMAMRSPNYWFTILIITMILMLPVVSLRFFWFDTQPTLSDRIRIHQNIKRLKSRSEFQLRPRSSARSSRRRRGSTRSGYAFAHQQGFGDLITRGVIAMRPSRSTTQNRLAPIKESPSRESKVDIEEQDL